MAKFRFASDSSCSLHDGIEVDNQGKPAAVIGTEPFVPTARPIARVWALPDYQFAVVPHPIGSLTKEELRERARAAAPQVLKILCNTSQSKESP